MEDLQTTTPDPGANDIETAARLGGFDWSATPLGPSDQWPASLREAVGQELAGRTGMPGLVAPYFVPPLQLIFAQAPVATERSRDSEQRYRNLLLQSPFAVAIFKGPDMLITFANEAIKAMWGKGAAVEGRFFSELMPEIKRQGLLELMQQVYTTGQPFVATESPGQVLRNGQLEQAYFNFVLQPLREADSAISGVTCIAQEVTINAVVSKKVEASEQQKIGILNSLNSHIAVLNSSGEIIMVNEAWNKFAQENGDITLRGTGVGENYLAVLERAKGENAEEAPVVSAGIQAVLKGELPIYCLEYPCHSPTQQRWFMLQVSPLTYAGGGVVIAHTDISARRLSEDALRASEQRLRTLSELLEQKVQERTAELTAVNEAFEHAEAISQLGNYKWDFDTNTVTWSKNMYAIYGLTPATFTPELERIMAFTHPEDVDRVTENAWQAVETQTSLPISYRIIAADGRIRHVYRSGNIILDAAGNKWLVGTLQNVTAAVEKEQQLLQANQQLQQKNQEIAVSKYNKHFLTDFSERFSTNKISTDFFKSVVQYIADLTRLDYVLVGQVEETEQGDFNIRTIAMTVFGALADNIVYPMRNGPFEEIILGKTYVYPEHCRLTFPKNETLVAFGVEGYLGYPLFDNHGQAKGVIAVMHRQKIEDYEGVSSILKIVAKRTEMELERIRHEQDLQYSNQMLAEQNIALEKSNRDLEQFAHIASHDLQEPLRKIQTFANLLRRRDDPAEWTKYTQKIEESAFRMSQLIESVLHYSRVSQGEDPSEETDLNDIVARICTDFELMIQEKNAVVECAVLPTIPGVPLQLSQLFSNLFSNALKFSTGQPHIRITAQEVAGHPPLDPSRAYVHIRFEDNGIGFSQEYADRIFDIFQRLHNQQTYAGTGIGLALCKKIVENHGGTIMARGELGKGARFDIYLPK